MFVTCTVQLNIVLGGGGGGNIEKLCFKKGRFILHVGVHLFRHLKKYVACAVDTRSRLRGLSGGRFLIKIRQGQIRDGIFLRAEVFAHHLLLSRLRIRADAIPSGSLTLCKKCP